MARPSHHVQVGELGEQGQPDQSRGTDEGGLLDSYACLQKRRECEHRQDDGARIGEDVAADDDRCACDGSGESAANNPTAPRIISPSTRMANSPSIRRPQAAYGFPSSCLAMVSRCILLVPS